MKTVFGVVLNMLVYGLLTGCVTYSHEWRADSVDGKAVESSRLADHTLKTRLRYNLVGFKNSFTREVNAPGASSATDGRQVALFAKELEAFAPEIFSSSPDALPVTIQFEKPYSSAFAWLAILGYSSVDTITPFTVKVGSASMMCTSGYTVKLRTIPIVFFPFVSQPDTDFYSRAYMTTPGSTPAASVFSENFRKTWMLGLALALKDLENSRRVGK